MTFVLEFVIASLGTHLGSGGHEDFEVGIGENGSADVSSVHDNTFALSHLALPFGEFGTHGWDGANGTNVAADLHISYLVLDILVVEEGGVATSLLVEVEGDVDLVEVLFDGKSIGLVAIHEPMTKGKECYGTIHGTSVDVGDANGSSNLFCHSAFAAGRVSVNGDYDVTSRFHWL